MLPALATRGSSDKHDTIVSTALHHAERDVYHGGHHAQRDERPSLLELLNARRRRNGKRQPTAPNSCPSSSLFAVNQSRNITPNLRSKSGLGSRCQWAPRTKDSVSFRSAVKTTPETALAPAQPPNTLLSPDQLLYGLSQTFNGAVCSAHHCRTATSLTTLANASGCRGLPK
jgi:hypothetical protein